MQIQSSSRVTAPQWKKRVSFGTNTDALKSVLEELAQKGIARYSGPRTYTPEEELVRIVHEHPTRKDDISKVLKEKVPAFKFTLSPERKVQIRSEHLQDQQIESKRHTATQISNEISKQLEIPPFEIPERPETPRSRLFKTILNQPEAIRNKMIEVAKQISPAGLNVLGLSEYRRNIIKQELEQDKAFKPDATDSVSTGIREADIISFEELKQNHPKNLLTSQQYELILGTRSKETQNRIDARNILDELDWHGISRYLAPRNYTPQQELYRMWMEKPNVKEAINKMAEGNNSIQDALKNHFGLSHEQIDELTQHIFSDQFNPHAEGPAYKAIRKGNVNTFEEFAEFFPESPFTREMFDAVVATRPQTVAVKEERQTPSLMSSVETHSIEPVYVDTESAMGPPARPSTTITSTTSPAVFSCTSSIPRKRSRASSEYSSTRTNPSRNALADNLKVALMGKLKPGVDKLDLLEQGMANGLIEKVEDDDRSMLYDDEMSFLQEALSRFQIKERALNLLLSGLKRLSSKKNKIEEPSISEAAIGRNTVAPEQPSPTSSIVFPDTNPAGTRNASVIPTDDSRAESHTQPRASSLDEKAPVFLMDVDSREKSTGACRSLLRSPSPGTKTHDARMKRGGEELGLPIFSRPTSQHERKEFDEEYNTAIEQVEKYGKKALDGKPPKGEKRGKEGYRDRLIRKFGTYQIKHT